MGLPEGDSKEPALRALTEALTRAQTRYALIGGVAVQLYTREPRTTADLDVALARYDDIPRAELLATRTSTTATGPTSRKKRQ